MGRGTPHATSGGGRARRGTPHATSGGGIGVGEGPHTAGGDGGRPGGAGLHPRRDPERTLPHALVRERLQPFLAAARERGPSGHDLPPTSSATCAPPSGLAPRAPGRRGLRGRWWGRLRGAPGRGGGAGASARHRGEGDARGVAAPRPEDPVGLRPEVPLPRREDAAHEGPGVVEREPAALRRSRERTRRKRLRPRAPRTSSPLRPAVARRRRPGWPRRSGGRGSGSPASSSAPRPASPPSASRGS